MAENEVKINVTAETKKAVDGINRVEKEVKQLSKNATTGLSSLNTSLSGLTAGFGRLGGALGVGIAAIGIGAVTSKIRDFIAASNVQEEAVNQLNAALRRSGDFTQQNSQAIQDYAAELQKTSVVGDEVILNQLAIAKSMGATTEQAKRIVAASVDASAALNIGFEEAVKGISQTLGGASGTLGRYVKELRLLKREQLLAGDAIDLVSKLFAGAGSERLKTFSGQTTNLSNRIGDLQERLGDVAKAILIEILPAVEKGVSAIESLFPTEKTVTTKEIERLNIEINRISEGIERSKKSASSFDKFFNTVFGATTDAQEKRLNDLEAKRDQLQSKLDAISKQNLDSFGGSNDGDEVKKKEKENAELLKLEEEAAIAKEERRIAEQLRQEEITNEELEILRGNLELEQAIRLQAEENVLAQQKNSDAKREKQKLLAAKREVEISKASAKAEAQALKLRQSTQEQNVTATINLLNSLNSLAAAGGKKFFAIQKALALATIPLNISQGITAALRLPPPASFIQAAAVGAAGAAQLANVLKQQPPAFEQGGIVPGTSFSGDRMIARVNSGEMILNKQQQTALFEGISGGSMGGGVTVIEIDGREVARATRNAKNEGFAI